MAQREIFFNRGTKVEFNNDGDICEITGNVKIRGKYFILYRSLKTGKSIPIQERI